MPCWTILKLTPYPPYFCLFCLPLLEEALKPFLATCISGPIPVSTSQHHPIWGWRGPLEPPSCPSCIFVLLCLRRMDEDRVQMSLGAFGSWGRLRLWHGVMRSDWVCSLRHDECRQTEIQRQVNVPCSQPLGKMLRGSTSVILWQEHLHLLEACRICPMCSALLSASLISEVKFLYSEYSGFKLMCL